MRYILSVILTLYSLSLSSQLLDPVQWKSSIEDLGNNEYLLVFEADIDETWIVYSSYTPDNGPVATSINYEPLEGFTLDGGIEEIGTRKEGMDKLFGVEVIKFLADQPYILKQKIKADPNTKSIVGYLTYMTCDNEKCLPPTDVDFNFKLTGGAPTDVTAEPIMQEDRNTNSDLIVDESTGEPVVKSNIPSTVFEPVKWFFDINKKGESYELGFRANIEEGWAVYSTISNVDGPVPTSVYFDNEEDIEILEPFNEKGERHFGPDPMFDNVEVGRYFSDQPYQLIYPSVKSLNNEPITGSLRYMTCNSERCLPPTDIYFKFDLEAVTGEAVEAEEEQAEGDEDVLKALGYIGDAQIVDQSIPSLQESYLDPISDCEGGEDQGKKSLLWSFIVGFLGGLVAILTPCVFPMIPLTVSFFTKDTKRKGWVNGMIYSISIIIIYVALGLAITAIFGDEALNRLSTNWIANTIFFLIFVFFAFSFFGYYEITLPSSWSTKSDTLAEKGGFIGIFFMAFTLALVSFSCTGPIIGSALVSAASNALGPAIVMLGFAIALALPFGLFAAFPAWLNTLPQSGGWMNSVKVVLGFLELAFAFKFLSVADLTNHWGFLKYELFMGVWVLVGLLTTLYLFGFIKFPHDSPIKKLSMTRKLLATAFGLFTVYLASGFMYNETTKGYNSLEVISGFPPPAHYNFFLDPLQADEVIREEYPSYSICANNIPCFKDYFEGLEYARKQDKPVFIDFTGHGCVNCRKTEETIWINDDIRNKLINDWVLVSLYVDDDKKLEQKLYSAQREKPMRNIGNKWADFQIINFEQNSQPLYVMMTTDEKVIASPRGYRSSVKEYKEYMECGYNAYLNQNEGQ